MDKSEVYESQIKPLLEQIALICDSKDIPFFSTTIVAEDEETETHEVLTVTPNDGHATIELLERFTCGKSELVPVSDGVQERF